MNLHIRTATVDDQETMVGFQLAMATETEDLALDEARLRRGIAAALADANKGQYYIAEVDGRPAGMCMITYEWSDWRNATVLWIQSVYVAPAHRRAGIWKAMYEHLRQLVLTDDSLCGLRLYVESENRPAQTAYDRAGMTSDHYVMYEWMPHD